MFILNVVKISWFESYGSSADNVGMTYDSNVEWYMFLFCENWLG